MTKRAIIVEASKEIDRRVDPRDSAPMSTRPIDNGEHSSLWWILDSLSKHGIDDVTYVGSYHIEKILHSFKYLTCIYCSPHEQRDEIDKISNSFSPEDELLLIDATTVIVARAGMNLNQRGVGVCNLFGKISPVGIVSLRAEEFRAYNVELEAWDSIKSLGHRLVERGLPPINMNDVAAPVSDRQAVIGLVFKGKAQTLENLSTICKNAVVLESVRISAVGWLENPLPLLEKIKKHFPDAEIIIRSSASSEDGIQTSGAGQFLTIAGINTKESDSVKNAVDEVIQSYRKDGRSVCSSDEVLVQLHISNLKACGVLLTRDIRNGAPYFVLNVDSKSGKSDVVTSGSEGQLETYYISWNSAAKSEAENQYYKILDAAREVMALTRLDALDIEFGFDNSGECYLFQARPMAVSAPLENLNDQDVLSAVEQGSEFVSALAPVALNTVGHKTLYSNMADWNPAEMLGSQPRVLDISLYQNLIGNKVWATARAKINYKNMSASPLILNICGRPYVDVRASLNSFLPNGLDNVIAEKWIDHCLDKLANDPPLHDKVEFDVTATCWLPEYHFSLAPFTEAGLSETEAKAFVSELASLTGNMISGRELSAQNLLQMPAELVTHIPSSLNSASATTLARFTANIIERCKTFGTEPFSIMARYAFVSMAILKSLLKTGILNNADYDSILHSIPTVSGEFSKDVKAWVNGDHERSYLVEKYGHLRPQSYNILSPNYRDAPEYFEAAHSTKNVTTEHSAASFEELLKSKSEALQPLCDSLNVNIDQLVQFIRFSISGREQLKFEFMKSVSVIFDLVGMIGNRFGMTKEQMSHIPIGEILRLTTESTYGEFASHLRRTSGQNAKLWKLSGLVKLPDLITSPSDLFSQRKEDWRPNFITRKTVCAETAVVTEITKPQDLNGKIVLIEAADPGFDWIFGCDIAGLATRYGGVASHMSIRAAEFDLPAAIGCGEDLFEQMCAANTVELSCSQEKVRCS